MEHSGRLVPSHMVTVLWLAAAGSPTIKVSINGSFEVLGNLDSIYGNTYNKDDNNKMVWGCGKTSHCPKN